MPLKITYPLEGHETAESSTFFVGSVSAGECLKINDEAVSVSPSGYFSHLVSLNLGKNDFVLQAGEETAQRNIIRHTAPILLDIFFKSTPPTIESNLNTDVSVLSGNYFRFWVRLPRHVSATLSLSGREVPLTPLASVRNHPHVFGYPHQAEAIPEDSVLYTAVLETSSFPPETPFQAELIIQYKEQEQRIALKGSFNVWATPRFAKILTEKAISRYAPDIGARLTPQLKNTIFGVNRIEENWAYSKAAHFWITLSDLELSETPFAITPNYLRSIHADFNQQIKLELYSDVQIPVDIQASETNLTLKFLETLSLCDLIRVTQAARLVGLENITCSMSSEQTTEVIIQLSSSLFGYQLSYLAEKQAYQLIIKTKKNLEEKIRILIDPGHGGEELGAIAPNGQAEKDLNLHLAQKLAAILKTKPQLEVALTRESDTTVSLDARLQASQTWQTDLFISLHHNALPDGRDPAKERGLVTFYYHVFSQPLAKHIQDMLLEKTDFPDYGLSQNSLAMCRQSHCLSLLLECGFLTHPFDAELSLSESHQENFVAALAQAINDLMT